MDTVSSVPARPIRVGVIGPGSIAGERLVPALSRLPGAQFWSVLSRSEERAQAFAAAHKAGSPRPAQTDLAAFLADPLLDAVIVASPDRLHASQALAAARAGKHIFVEKPMATSSQDAQAVVAACREAGIRLAVGYHLRFHAGHRLVQAALQEGTIGQLHHMQVCWTMKAPPGDWRASAETGRWWSLGALGTHALDLVRWMMMPACGQIVQAQSVLSNGVYGGPHDETALVSLRFASGATAQVVTSVVFRAPRLVEIFGSQGSVSCLDTLGPRGAGQIMVAGQPLSFTVQDPYEAELANFLSSIANQAHLEVDGLEGMENIVLLERATEGRSKT